ncbi:alpha/beta fold hydrolase [Mycolicibacterium sp. P1-18]|uniref:alpha/beta fold hydrolase n=1 Tax=Mycolicibacterium sp. P1-18 TaxID=2024615 RepID=UPI0011F1A379|nr:alpha/beta fold hydrolase [Mycolicibacterium sp. P1-18]KAA0095221.1 alpha/beta fold hydrolase [Mycolicibacterium sp. P1-18]
MTMNAGRRRVHDRLAALPGVSSVRRPVLDDGPDEFDLFYVRVGEKSDHPLLFIPGGPGAASIALYRGLRKHAVADGLDVIMVEHRGVGMSRHDDDGADLPLEAMTVEAVVADLDAVLEHAGVESAVVYGTSYGTYLAAGLGVRHPGRVHAMILDSPLLSADDVDLVREAVRRVLWDGVEGETAELAEKVRHLVAEDVLTPVATQLAADMYGLGGAELLGRQLDLLLNDHDWVWGAVGLGTRLLVERKTPFHNEPDLVGRIGYRELNYGAVPDGKPLDPAVALRDMATGEVDFVAEPYDLVAEMPKFSWPTVIISGGRDLTTPRAVACRIAELIPDAVLVEMPSSGHSVIDTKERSALDVVAAVYAGEAAELPSRSAELDAVPSMLSVRLLKKAITAAAVAESVVPSAVPRAVRNVTTS